MALLHAPAPRYQQRTPAYIVRLRSAVSLRDRARGLISPTFCDGVHLRAQPINCQSPERIKNALSRVPETVWTAPRTQSLAENHTRQLNLSGLWRAGYALLPCCRCGDLPEAEPIHARLSPGGLS